MCQCLKIAEKNMRNYKIEAEQLTARGGKTLKRGQEVPESVFSTPVKELLQKKLISEVPAAKPDAKTNPPEKN